MYITCTECVNRQLTYTPITPWVLRCIVAGYESLFPGASGVCVPPVLVLHAQDVDSVSLCEAQAVLSITVIVVQGNSEGALVAAKLHVEERQAVTHHRTYMST